MFETELQGKIKGIFGAVATYDAPSESFEQEKIFIEIMKNRPNISKGKLAKIRVEGQLVIFAQAEKLKFGFFSRKVEQAPSAFKKGLFFFDMDTDVPTSPARMNNLHERRCSFIFLYEGQYDPDQGEISELQIGE